MAGLAKIRSLHLSVFQPHPRPRTRDECREGIRPCPFIACRHHLAVDDNGEDGRERINHAMVEAIEDADDASPCDFDTCALDVAERGESTVYEISDYAAIWHSNVDPALQSAMEKLSRDPTVAQAARDMGIPVPCTEDDRS